MEIISVCLAPPAQCIPARRVAKRAARARVAGGHEVSAQRDRRHDRGRVEEREEGARVARREGLWAPNREKYERLNLNLNKN